MTVISLLPHSCKILPLYKEPILHQVITPSQTIVIPSQSGLEVLELRQILMLNSESNYTKIYLLDGEIRMVAKTLKCFDVKLQNSFLRVHNSYLINPKHIKSFCFKDNQLRLKNNIEVPVSRAKKAILLDFLKRSSI